MVRGRFEEKAWSFCKNWQGKADGRILCTHVRAPFCPYTCSREYLIKGNRWTEAKVPTTLFTYTCCETRKEYEDFLNHYECTPVQYLNSFGFFQNRVLAAHCVYLDEKDLEIFAENDVNVVYNPGSNMKLGSGIAPVIEMLGKGYQCRLWHRWNSQ